MIHYQPKLESVNPIAGQAARKIHAEDICVGDWLAVSDVTHEFASFLWDGLDSFETKKEELIRINYLAHDDFDIYRVKAICLPFVYTKNSKKKNRVFDLRLTNLFRLTEQFASEFKKGLKVKKKSSRSTKSKNKGKRRK